MTRTKVTDAGLTYLKGLTHLRVLDLGDTMVTDAGVDDLCRALPHTLVKTRFTPAPWKGE